VRLWTVALAVLAVPAVVSCFLAVDVDRLAGGPAADAGPGPGPDAPPNDAPPDSVGADAPRVAYRDVVLADHPVAYWRLGEKPGTTAVADLAGQHPGTYSAGAELGVPGALALDPDTAVHFAAEARAEFGDNFDFVNANFAIELWLKADLIDATYRYALSKRTDVGSANGYGLYVQSSDGGSICATYVNQSNFRGACGAIGPGVFRHVVFEFVDLECRLYLDGSRVDKEFCNDVWPPDTNAPLTIANFSSLNGGGFVGTIDEVALYSPPLAADRVEAHYRAGAGL
jgi:hypothetical protein